MKKRELDGLEKLTIRRVRARRDLIVESSDREERLRGLTVAAVSRARPGAPSIQSLVLTSDSEAVAAIGAAVNERLRIMAPLKCAVLDPKTDARQEEALVAPRPDVIVTTPARLIDHIRRDSVDIGSVSTIVVDVADAGSIEQFDADLHFVYTKLSGRPATAVFIGDLGREFDLLEDLLRRPTTVSDQSWTSPRTTLPSGEEHPMSNLPFDAEQMKRRIEDIVHAIHHNEDPVEMTRYRDFVRKHTTIFNRGYVLAYLLKHAAAPAQAKGRPQRSSSAEPASDKQSIFVSIGRSKRIRSRDLITFFTSADGISQEDLGQVKVLDNYSFVEVSTAKAQAAIDALNGKELRGRKLTVNFARRK